MIHRKLNGAIKKRLEEIENFIENELDYPYVGQKFKYKATDSEELKIIADCWTVTLDFKYSMFSFSTKKGCGCNTTDLDFFMEVKDNMDVISDMFYGIKRNNYE